MTTTTTTTTTTVSINGKPVAAEVFRIDHDDFLAVAYVSTPDGEDYGTRYTVAGDNNTYYTEELAIQMATLQLYLDRKAIADEEKAEEAFVRAMAQEAVASKCYDLDKDFMEFCTAENSPATAEQAKYARARFEVSRADLDAAEGDFEAAEHAVKAAKRAADQARARIAQAERVLAKVMTED